MRHEEECIMKRYKWKESFRKVAMFNNKIEKKAEVLVIREEIPHYHKTFIFEYL